MVATSFRMATTEAADESVRTGLHLALHLRGAGSPGKGKGDGQLMCPADVLVVQHGGQARVVVADTGNHRVQSYTLEGKHVRSFGSKRSSDAGPNTFLSPDCLGWDALHAHLYVSCLDTPGMQTQIPPALFM